MSRRRFIRTPSGRLLTVKQNLTSASLSNVSKSISSRKKSSILVYLNGQLQAIDETDLSSSEKQLQSWPPNFSSFQEVRSDRYAFIAISPLPGRLPPESWKIDPPANTVSSNLFGLTLAWLPTEKEWRIWGFPVYPYQPPSGTYGYWEKMLIFTSYTRAGTSTHSLYIRLTYDTSSGSGSSSPALPPPMPQPSSSAPLPGQSPDVIGGSILFSYGSGSGSGSGYGHSAIIGESLLFNPPSGPGSGSGSGSDSDSGSGSDSGSDSGSGSGSVSGSGSGSASSDVGAFDTLFTFANYLGVRFRNLLGRPTFTMYLSGNEAWVRSFHGNEIGNRVALPITFQGAPVTSVTGRLFETQSPSVVDVFGGNMRTLGNYAFEGFAGIEVNLADGITSLGFRCFAACPNLTYLAIPATVTYIGPDAFANCPKLDTIRLPNIFREGHQAMIDARLQSFGLNLSQTTVNWL